MLFQAVKYSRKWKGSKDELYMLAKKTQFGFTACCVRNCADIFEYSLRYIYIFIYLHWHLFPRPWTPATRSNSTPPKQEAPLLGNLQTRPAVAMHLLWNDISVDWKLDALSLASIYEQIPEEFPMSSFTYIVRVVMVFMSRGIISRNASKSTYPDIWPQVKQGPRIFQATCVNEAAKQYQGLGYQRAKIPAS